MSEYIASCYGSAKGGSYTELREEIVRCKDCEYYEPNDYIHFTCEYLQTWAEPDDYCAWGERK